MNLTLSSGVKWKVWSAIQNMMRHFYATLRNGHFVLFDDVSSKFRIVSFHLSHLSLALPPKKAISSARFFPILLFLLVHKNLIKKLLLSSLSRECGVDSVVCCICCRVLSKSNYISWNKCCYSYDSWWWECKPSFVFWCKNENDRYKKKRLRVKKCWGRAGDEHGKCVDGDLPSLSFSLLWWLQSESERRWCDKTENHNCWRDLGARVWAETSWISQRDFVVVKQKKKTEQNYYLPPAAYGRNCRILCFCEKQWETLSPLIIFAAQYTVMKIVISVLWTLSLSLDPSSSL